MTNRSNLLKALGLGAATVVVTAGTAFAATATTAVNVRSGPGTWHRIVDTLYAGEYVRIVDRSRGWCRVVKSGPDGWVACAYLTNRGYREPTPPRFSFSFGFPGYFGQFPYPGHYPGDHHGHDHDHGHDHNH